MNLFNEYVVLISTYWNVNALTLDTCKTKQPVLISTYWNVNMFHLRLLANENTGFNLNLLECKHNFLQVLSSHACVLISTYWNVNVLKRCPDCPTGWVLISTYWNVNYCGYKATHEIQKRFNLNLLECKRVNFNASFSSCKMVLISTYWNVNRSES